MADTPEEHEPGTDVETDRQEVDGSLILAGFPSELLVHLAETLGNPLALLVSKAHLSKAFREAARAAQATLRHADLCKWARTVDDAVVGAVVSKCSQLSSLNLEGCGKITDAAVVAVAAGCPQLTALYLNCCHNITDAAVVAVASGCKQLTTLDLSYCRNVTDAAVVAVASSRKQLTTLYARVLMPPDVPTFDLLGAWLDAGNCNAPPSPSSPTSCFEEAAAAFSKRFQCWVQGLFD